MGYIAHTTTLATSENSEGMSAIKAKLNAWSAANGEESSPILSDGLCWLIGERGGWACLCSTGSKSGWGAQQAGLARSRALVEEASWDETGWRAAEISCAGADSETEGLQGVGPRVDFLDIPLSRPMGLMELREAPTRIFALFVTGENYDEDAELKFDSPIGALRESLAWAQERAEMGAGRAMINGYRTVCAGLDLRGLAPEEALEQSARFLLSVRACWVDAEWVAVAQTASAWENVGVASLQTKLSYGEDKEGAHKLIWDQATAMAERGALRLSAPISSTKSSVARV